MPLVQEVGKDKSGAFLNETSDNPYSSSSGAAYDFYRLNRLKAAGGKCDAYEKGTESLQIPMKDKIFKI